jgi:hypothetical protein
VSSASAAACSCCCILLLKMHTPNQTRRPARRPPFPSAQCAHALRIVWAWPILFPNLLSAPLSCRYLDSRFLCVHQPAPPEVGRWRQAGCGCFAARGHEQSPLTATHSRPGEHPKPSGPFWGRPPDHEGSGSGRAVAVGGSTYRRQAVLPVLWPGPTGSLLGVCKLIQCTKIADERERGARGPAELAQLGSCQAAG